MSNSLMNAAAGMLLLVTGFCCSIIVARLLGPDANGTIAFALWIATTGALVAELGTGILLMRLLPQLRARGMEEHRRRGFAAYLALPVVASTLGLVLLYGLLSSETGSLDGLSKAPDIVVLTGILLFVQSIGAFSKNYLIGEQRLGTFLRLTAVASALQLSLVLAGALAFGVEGALAGYIAGQVAQFIHVLRILAARRDSAGYSARFLATTSAVLFFEFAVSAIFLSRPELFFLQQFRTVGEVGFYAVALSLANLALQLPVQLTGSLIPFYAERREAGEGEMPSTVFSAVVRSFAYITFPLCFGLAAIAHPLVVSIYGEAFAPSALIVAILAAGSPAYVFVQLTTQYLYSMDRVKVRLVASSLGAIAMVGGCLAVVPIWGGVGAAIVRGAVFLFMGALLLARMRFAGAFLGPVVLKVAAAAAACGLAAFAVAEFLAGILGIVCAVVLGALVYGLMLRLLNTVPAEDTAVIGDLLDRLPSASGRLSRRFLGMVSAHAASKPAGE